jgi:hypothetical protein
MEISIKTKCKVIDLMINKINHNNIIILMRANKVTEIKEIGPDNDQMHSDKGITKTIRM